MLNVNTSNFLALSIFFQFLKMAPAPNFGVFIDFAHPFLTEVDFSLPPKYTNFKKLCFSGLIPLFASLWMFYVRPYVVTVLKKKFA